MDKVFAAGRVAVIIGSSTGIGRAAAKTFVSKYGMKVAMGDLDAEELNASAEEVRKLAKAPADVVAVTCDASSTQSIKDFHDAVTKAFGSDIAVLFNNAGIGLGGGVLAPRDRWEKVIAVNGWGPINGTQEFLPAMLEQGTPGMIINTGSKQGITAPPGNLAYNISKGMVKLFTEGLAHELRNGKNPALSAHLLVPGWVNSMIGVKTAKALGTEHKGPSELNPAAGGWSPQETVDYMLKRLSTGDFYIICPDNETTEEMDQKRMTWAMQDVTQNRPALSRWHPDWAPKFKEYMEKAGL